MKKLKANLIPEIVSPTNLDQAFKRVISVRYKKTRAGQELIRNKDKVLDTLAHEIRAGTFRVPEFQTITVKSKSGKEREINFPSAKKKIGLTAIMTVINDAIKTRYITTTGSGIKGRGAHKLIHRIKDDLKKSGYQYCYKWDIAKFFPSIPREVIKKLIKDFFGEKILRQILLGFISDLDSTNISGLPVGFSYSLTLANLLLSIKLDHVIKDEMGVKYYYRYCDDGLILGETKAELWNIRNNIYDILNKLGLSLKSNEGVIPVKEVGVTFLGYQIWPTHILVGTKTKKRNAKAIKNLAKAGPEKEVERKRLVMAFWSHIKHASSWHLIEKLDIMSDIKNIKEFKIPAFQKNGQKWFDVQHISITQLTNLESTFLDFEDEIETKNGPRMLVLIRLANGQRRKFFTSSQELLYQLRYIKEHYSFPFKGTLEAINYGKGTKYRLQTEEDDEE